MIKGGWCPFNASVTIGNVPLCKDHEQRVRDELYVPPLPPVPHEPGVVYYVIDWENQEIKIGTSTRLRQRMKALRKERPGAQLLATERGSYALESQRHHEFSEIAVGSEWFRITKELLKHIEAVRDQGFIDTASRRSGLVPDDWRC